MSLYYESAPFLEASTTGNESLKTQVYRATDIKSTPGQVYALVSETRKWSGLLSEVIDKAGILRLERKLTPVLSLLLAHDLLLSKHGVAAPREHALRLAIERHRARLSAEFTKCRLKAGFATVQAWKAAIEADVQEETHEDAGQPPKWKHPRWIRINTLISSVDTELSGALAGFEIVETLQDVLRSPLLRKCLVLDKHIPSLVAIPSGIDLSKSSAYLDGRIIFQDKASCFPAALLDPQPTDGDVLDACAAPGNKTTHLAALMAQFQNQAERKQRTLYACERDKARSATLEKMIHTAGADRQDQFKTTCLLRQDFLRLDPGDTRFKNVGAILLDPSCSGSGIIGREETDAAAPAYKLVLPRTPNRSASNNSSQGKKRKRNSAVRKPEPGSEAAQATHSQNHPAINEAENIPAEDTVQTRKSLPERLEALSNFQLALLSHAFRFPSARKVVYSTCSVYAEENEQVVLRALHSAAAKERGWRVASRAEQVDGLREWAVRGDGAAVAEYHAGDGSMDVDVDAVADACLRCERGTEQGTMGFFVVKFVRDGADGTKNGLGSGRTQGQAEGKKALEYTAESDEEEWEGLSD